MAYIVNEEDEKKNQPSADSSGGLVQSAPQSVGNMPNTPASSGTYTNLQNYIQANPQGGQQLAQGITNQAESLENKANSALQSSQAQFQADVQKNTPQFDQATLDSLASRNLTASQLTPEQQNQIMNYSQAQYTGPMNFAGGSGFTNYQQPIQESYQGLKDFISQTQSEPGRMNLLQNIYKTPTYSQGQATLDQALFQTAPQNKIDELATVPDAYQKQLDAASKQANDTVEQIKNQIPVNQQLESDRLKAAQQAELDYLAKLQAAAQSKQNAAVQNARTALKDISINSPSYNRLFGDAKFDPADFGMTDLTKYISGAPDYSLRDAAGATDLTDVQTLAKLMGQDPTNALNALGSTNSHGLTFNQTQAARDALNKWNDFSLAEASQNRPYVYQGPVSQYPTAQNYYGNNVWDVLNNATPDAISEMGNMVGKSVLPDWRVIQQVAPVLRGLQQDLQQKGFAGVPAMSEEQWPTTFAMLSGGNHRFDNDSVAYMNQVRRGYTELAKNLRNMQRYISEIKGQVPGLSAMAEKNNQVNLE